MSTISVTNLKNAASASNNLVLDTSGNTTAAGTVAMGSSYLRNRIINGAMVIDQRNAGASVTPATGSYTLDRYNAALNQASKYSVQQNAGAVTPPTGFSNYLGVTSTSSYSVLTGDFFGIVQNIEGFNTADFGWGAAGAASVTLSFWVRASITGTYSVSFRNASSNRSYPATYTVNSANTWEYKTITVPGDTSGTWGTGNGIGIQVWFSLGAGATLSGTANAWSGSNLTAATGSTSVVGTNGATFYITGVQLEVGTVATPFERRLYGTELALCQRYYWASDTSTNHFGIAGYALAGGNIASSIIYPVAMRASPTVTIGAQSLINTTGLVANSITSLGYLLLISATANGNAQATLNSSRVTHSIEL